MTRSFFTAALFVLAASAAHAQVQTGSIAGIVTDQSSAVLPGVTVSLSGEKLIGGAQTQTTGAVEDTSSGTEVVPSHHPPVPNRDE